MVLDTSFPLHTIGSAAPESVQFVFVSATMPKEVADQLKQEFPGLKPVKGPGLHRISPLTSLNVIDCTPLTPAAERTSPERAVALREQRNRGKG